MTAATSDVKVKTRERAPQPFRIANAIDVYSGSLGSLAGKNHATAGKRGYAIPFAGAAGEIPMGIFGGQSDTGNTGATEGQIPEVEIDTGGRVQLMTVAAIANDATDVSKVVYATDDSTFTVTEPATRPMPIGIIVRRYNATQVYVALLSFFELAVLQLCGRGRQLMYLGSFDADTITAANIRTGIVMPFAGRFLSTYAMIDIAPTGGGGTALISLKIDTVAVTGGVVTVATGDAKAAKKAGTAITAANVFAEGSAVDVVAATVTDMTAGRFDLYAIVAAELGL